MDTANAKLKHIVGDLRRSRPHPRFISLVNQQESTSAAGPAGCRSTIQCFQPPAGDGDLCLGREDVPQPTARPPRTARLHRLINFQPRPAVPQGGKDG